MSASKKKKLRKEQAESKLTPRQQQEQAEAKKLKVYTRVFVGVMIAIVLSVATILGIRAVKNSGIINKLTKAAMIGNRELNTVEMNYYYMDAINGYYNQWSESFGDKTDEYLKSIFGLDTKVALNKQYHDKEKKITWADYFINEAIGQAQNDYAMYDLAMKEGYKLTDEERANFNTQIENLNLFAVKVYGYPSVDKYLAAVYGDGASLDTYKSYYERSLIASSYFAAHEDTFVYTDEQREEYAKDKVKEYNSYSYTICQLSYTTFRGEGTKDKDGKVTYTAEQDKAAREAMEAAAKKLAEETKTVEELKEKVKEVAPEGKTLKVEEMKDVLYENIGATALQDWLTHTDRKAGDIAAIPVETTKTDADGKETKETNTYYVVIYGSVTDNTSAMADIGYIFTHYQGEEKEDIESGEHKHTQEDKDKTKAAVEGFLKTWKEGAKTEASLEELANSLIKEKKADEGGLVANVNPGSNFDDQILNWALNAERKEGDTTIIEADEGFYLIYYSGKSDLNYRHYMIDNDKRAEDYQKWYEDAIAAVPTKRLNVSKMDQELVMNP